jgi:spore germination protein GerM
VTARRRLLLLLLVPIAVGGCGLPDDSRPRPIAAEDAPLALGSTTTTSAPATGTTGIEVWLVDSEGNLRAVERAVESATAQAAVEALLAAPNESEDARFDTAIPAGSTVVASDERPVVTVQLGLPNEGLLGIQGGQQLLAFGQIVSTVTELTGVEGVRFIAADGTPVATPTQDSTIVDRPVTANDYASLRRA